MAIESASAGKPRPYPWCALRIAKAESNMLDITVSTAYHTNMGRKLISDQLRAIIDGCRHTRYAIAKATGISQPTLSRFMSGERGLPMKTLDQLGVFLDLQVAMRPKRRAPRKDK